MEYQWFCVVLYCLTSWLSHSYDNKFQICYKNVDKNSKAEVRTNQVLDYIQEQIDLICKSSGGGGEESNYPPLSINMNVIWNLFK